MSRLRRGDLPPRVVTDPPGPESRRISRRLAGCEAPGVNTLYAGEPSIVWQEARSANVLDVDGNRYIDLTAGFGVAAVGHRHPRVVTALRRQAGCLLHGLADVHAHPLRATLARRLIRRVPVDNGQVYFAISGADAVEIALKTALLATRRPGVVAFEPAYHGLTLGALHATSRPAFRRSFAQHLHPHVQRLPFGCPTAEIDARVAWKRVGGVILEPVVAREGVLLPPVGWLSDLADLCRRRRVLLIADEIFTGFGRTGRWFDMEREGVRLDLLCCGKALGGGLPIAVVVGRRHLMAAWRTDGEALHAATFLAHPLACAAANATLDILAEEALPRRAARLGRRVAERLVPWPDLFPRLSAVRGEGLLWGLELESAAAARTFTRSAARRGILLVAGGPDGRVAQIVPPLTIQEHQLDEALERLAAALAEL